MVKYTLAEAQAYFATRRMRICWQEWSQCYRLEFISSTFSPKLYKTLDGAVKSVTHDNGAEFERWLIQYRHTPQPVST